MGTVAERPRSRVFATAEDNVFVNFGFEQDRIECGSHMRTVAERLLARTATRAPQIAPTGLPSLFAQAAMSVLEGRVLSTSLRAVSMPATGNEAGSSLPICTSTDA